MVSLAWAEVMLCRSFMAIYWRPIWLSGWMTALKSLLASSMLGPPGRCTLIKYESKAVAPRLKILIELTTLWNISLSSSVACNPGRSVNLSLISCYLHIAPVKSVMRLILGCR